MTSKSVLHALYSVKKCHVPALRAFRGVPNPLMYNENTVMLLGDAKCNLVDLRNELAKMLPSVCEV